MKLSRSELKIIVKECLIEILKEGLGDIKPREHLERGGIDVGETISSVRRKTAQKTLLTAKKQQPSAALMQAVQQESGGNKLMQSILADTAMTTLPTMLASSTPGGDALVSLSGQGVGAAEMVVAQNSPEDLFGEEAASKWSNLAFMGKPGPKAA